MSDTGWLGHPRGLSTLFFTEMWERFSYYGMRALLILYMTAPLAAGGLEFDTPRAASVYGWYTFGVYALAIPGGWVADRWLGQYRTVLYGGIIIALGHFSMALATLPAFFGGLFLIMVGTGLLKPNISTMVGSLYEQEDARRDAGFSIFYMGINLGAFIAPLIVGTLGQRVDWHVGFAAAGVGMAAGVIQYVLGKHRLRPALERLAPVARGAAPGTPRPPAFTATEWKRIAAVGVFFVFSSLFWAAFEQAGSSLNLFADRLTRLSVFGLGFPSTWFQSLNSMFLIALAPVFAWLWIRLGPREPSTVVKFTYGLLGVGLGFLLLVPAAGMAQGGALVSPAWLVGVYLLHTMGELCLSPVGLSVVTKLAPQRVVGLMMGVWFLSIATGNKIGGWVAGFFDALPLPLLFGAVAATTMGSAVVLWLIMRPVRGLMGGVH
ncbi:MAG TPA: peptide MFS transporter [Gemmatimonadales bacterium]|nr:peptide MFS transporter [Gemmatimonadales bacterium]